MSVSISWPSRDRSPTPAKIEMPRYFSATAWISSITSTVLPTPAPPNIAALPPLAIGASKVDDLDAGLEQRGHSRFFGESGRLAVDRPARRVGRQRRSVIAHRAGHVDQSSEHRVADGDGDRLACAAHLHAARKPCRRLQSDGAHSFEIQVAVDFQHQLFGAIPVDHKRIVDGREFTVIEAHFHDWAAHDRYGAWGLVLRSHCQVGTIEPLLRCIQSSASVWTRIGMQLLRQVNKGLRFQRTHPQAADLDQCAGVDPLLVSRSGARLAHPTKPGDGGLLPKPGNDNPSEAPTMTAHPRQALVGDIGGTNARFAIADVDELTVKHFASFRCDMFSSLRETIEGYLASVPHRPTMAGFAIAGPVTPEGVHLTNRNWTVTHEELRTATGVEKLHVVNDFEALALSLPYLTAHDLEKVCGGEPQPDAAKIALGPGTGLGMAGLVPAKGGGWESVGGEGGHVSFSAESADEAAIAEHMRGSAEGHLSTEQMVSGPALPRLYAIVSELRGAGGGKTPSAHDIVEHALAQDDPIAEAVLDYFVKWLGRYAGDMALAFGARGGVYLGGGISPRIVDLLMKGSFQSAFTAKGRLSEYLEPIPVYVVKANDAGLRGVAVALSNLVPATS